MRDCPGYGQVDSIRAKSHVHMGKLCRFPLVPRRQRTRRKTLLMRKICTKKRCYCTRVRPPRHEPSEFHRHRFA